jgi:hypothetical protein
MIYNNIPKHPEEMMHRYYNLIDKTIPGKPLKYYQNYENKAGKVQ